MVSFGFNVIRIFLLNIRQVSVLINGFYDTSSLLRSEVDFFFWSNLNLTENDANGSWPAVINISFFFCKKTLWKYYSIYWDYEHCYEYIRSLICLCIYFIMFHCFRKCNKPLKPKTTIQVVSDSKESIIPIHITAGNYRDAQTLCISYGNSVVQTFEDIVSLFFWKKLNLIIGLNMTKQL